MYYVTVRHLQLAWSYPGCHPLKMLIGVDPFLNLLLKDFYGLTEGLLS